MTTSKQQAAQKLVQQIDNLRAWAQVNAPSIAVLINQAIATELGNQAAGFTPSAPIRKSGGFGDFISDLLGSTGSSSTYDLGGGTDALDLSTIGGNLSSTLADTTAGDSSIFGLTLPSIGGAFSSAGSSATPSLAATGIASSPTTVAGVINSIGNTFNAAVKAIYEPQITIAQAQAQIGAIQAQSQAAQLALTSQATQQQSMTRLVELFGLGAIAVFAFKSLAGAGDKRQSTTTTSRRNY